MANMAGAMAGDKYTLDNVKVTEQHELFTPGGSNHDNASILVRQTRTRRLFSTTQLFAFSLMFLATWAGMGTSMYYALLNGGSAGLLFNYIIVSVGVLFQAACFAELASIIPIAGAQYYWTYQFAPKSIRRFITWIQGWATWLGYIAALASAINTSVVNIGGTAQVNSPNYENSGWHTTLICIGMLVFLTVINVFFFQIVPWFEFATGIVNVCFFFVTLVALWVMSPRNSAEILVTRESFSGWNNNFVSWNLGMLTQIWMFIGFECVIHMGEETKNARRAAPQAMFWSMVANIILGFIMVFTYLICMPPVEDVITASNTFIYIALHSTGSKAVTTTLGAGLIIVNIGCNMSAFSSVTRLTWAWARDGALPSFFGLVDGKRRVPLRAVLFTCLLVTFLALLNLGSGTYIALGAITSLASLALYFSYLIILIVVLHARLTGKLKTSVWTMGRWGLPVNICAVVYTLYTIIWLPFPTTLPVTASNMNYSGPVFGAVMIGAIVIWILWGSRHWPGPNKGIVDIVLRLASEA